jgi:glucose/arabinose dehydrogenase
MNCCLRSLCIYLVVALAGWIGCQQDCPAQTSAQRVASGLSNPLYGTFAPGDTSRLFLVEQGSGGTARIKVLDLDNGNVMATPFLTISGLSTGGERGLLGMAFDPDYANNGHFYTYGSYPGGPGNHQSRIRRYTVDGDPATSNIANPASISNVMSFSEPFFNHNGGWIGFDPTTSNPNLYIATGDGGSGGDPRNNAQDITNNLLGKMLRIDVSGDDFPGSSTANYAIPDSNPFVGVTGDDEIWAYGLRNSWRNSFDRANGDLWIGDVGQNAREEINFQPADSPGGENYGWRVMEGLNCFDNSQAGGNPPCNDPGFTRPIYTYGHNGGALGGFSVTGGYVYRGSVAQYEGLYFFADYITENIWTIDPLADNPQASVIRRNLELVPSAGSISGLSSFAEDANGELYIFSFTGQVFRVESTARDAIWNGDDATAGASGDGTNWSDANNWTRDGVVDQAIVSKDRAVFAAGSSVDTINLKGTQTVGGAVFESGYTITGGSLVVLSGNVTVNSGVTATLDADLAAERINTSIRKLGSGRLNVNGAVGQTVVMEGTLGGTGVVDVVLRALAGSEVAPGSGGVGTLTADRYEMAAGSTLEIEVATTEADRLAAVGTATISGIMEVIGDDYDPAVRGTIDQFMVVTASSVNGTFDQVTYDGTTVDQNEQNTHVGDGLFTSVLYNPTNVTLVNYFALPGDANGDGFVDGIDFIIWNENRFSAGTDWTMADFDGDGTTDGSDFIIWNDNRFTSVDLPSLVPEPTSAVMWASILMVLGLRRRLVAFRN